MPRPFAVLFMLLPPVVVAGCPVYDADCDSDRDCAPGYVCSQGSCVADTAVGPAPGRCHTSDDCADGLVCDRYNRCVEGSTGAAGEGGSGGTSGAAGADGQ
jgi:hypothetical protein